MEQNEDLTRVADHLRSVDRVNRLAWAASTLEEFDAVVEASTTIRTDDELMAHAFAVGARYVRVEPVAFQRGRRALIYAVTGSGREFIGRYGSVAQIAEAA